MRDYRGLDYKLDNEANHIMMLMACEYGDITVKEYTRITGRSEESIEKLIKAINNKSNVRYTVEERTSVKNLSTEKVRILSQFLDMM